MQNPKSQILLPIILVDVHLKRKAERVFRFLKWFGLPGRICVGDNFVSNPAILWTENTSDLLLVISSDLALFPKTIQEMPSRFLLVLPAAKWQQNSTNPISTHSPVIALSDENDIFLHHGVTQTRIGALVANFLSAIHSHTHTIILARHGQSESNLSQRVGGNSPLTAVGLKHAQAMAKFLQTKSVWINDGLEVWSSQMKRVRMSCEPLEAFLPCKHTTVLNEINSGEFEGMSYSEIESKHPVEFAARQKDKLSYRYPGGESYRDVIERLHPLILEAERARNPIMILSHQGVLRAIYGYFRGCSVEEIPHQEIPSETLVVLTIRDGECTEERIRIT